MSILSKFLKGVLSSAEQKAKEVLKPTQPNHVPTSGTPSAGTVPTSSAANVTAPEDLPHGDSWGEIMPNEPNQFNYPGDYREYFADIFRTEFSEYTIDREDCTRRPATIFTLYKDGRRALVVELLSKKSSAEKVRRDCRLSGTPYLRFYYNYHGWWNTRSYVIRRCNAAIGR